MKILTWHFWEQGDKVLTNISLKVLCIRQLRKFSQRLHRVCSIDCILIAWCKYLTEKLRWSNWVEKIFFFYVEKKNILLSPSGSSAPHHTKRNLLSTKEKCARDKLWKKLDLTSSCLGNYLLQPSTSLEIIAWEDKHYESASIPQEINTSICIHREKTSITWYLWEHGNRNFALLKNISNDAQLCQCNNDLAQNSDSENDKSRCHLERSCEYGHFLQPFPSCSLRIWNCYIKEASGYLELTTEIFPGILNPFLPVSYSLPKLTLTVTDAAELDQQQCTDFSWHKKASKQDTGRYLQLSIYKDFSFC